VETADLTVGGLTVFLSLGTGKYDQEKAAKTHSSAYTVLAWIRPATQ